MEDTIKIKLEELDLYTLTNEEKKELKRRVNSIGKVSGLSEEQVLKNLEKKYGKKIRVQT